MTSTWKNLLSTTHTDGYTQPLASTSSDVDSGSSSGNSAHVLFRSMVVFIGIVGTFANALVLYAMLKSKQVTKNSVNILFVNQMSLDLFSCFWLIISYSVKLANVALVGSTGYWLCIFINSDNIVYFGLIGSSANLASIAIERYLKIVHPIWHKNHFKRWMTRAAVVIPWVYGVVANQPVTSATTILIEGRCIWGAVWISTTAMIVYGLWFFMSYFVVVLLSFVFSYGSIVFAVRRQSKIVTSQKVSNQMANAGSAQSHRIQMNTIKTMVIVSVLFVISWLPCNVYLLLFQLNLDIEFNNNIYYGLLFLAFLNVCLNPFIYAAKYELVKHHLTDVCRRLWRPGSVDDSIASNSVVVQMQSTNPEFINDN